MLYYLTWHVIFVHFSVTLATISNKICLKKSYFKGLHAFDKDYF